MVKRKVKSKARSIQLKRRSRKTKRKVARSRSYGHSKSWNDFLDQEISVRSLVKYSSITLAFVLVLVVVFMLGRVSVDAAEAATGDERSLQLSGQTKQVAKDGVDVQEDAMGSEDVEEDSSEDDESSDVSNLSETEDAEFDSDSQVYVYEPVGSAYEEAGDETVDEEDVDDSPGCTDKVAGFDYAYTKIGISVSNFQRENRGDNWASITSLKLTVTNNEDCTVVNPTRIKIKMNPKGKGSVWWDDDVYLPDSFRNMHPGKTVTEIIPVHVSYSDIYSEKDFRLALFDDYDIHMNTYKDYITFS